MMVTFSVDMFKHHGYKGASRRNGVKKVTNEMTTATNLTREEWLRDTQSAMSCWIDEIEGYSYPANVRVACGFPKSARGKGRHAIGQCWSSVASADEHFEIFICPTEDDAAEVAETLLHEMVDATVGTKAGHGAAFAKLAKALGFLAPMTQTPPSDELKARIAALVADMVAYPHGKLSNMEGPKKQTTRLVKCECDECGYVVRTTEKWLNLEGAPICPCSMEPMRVAS